MTDGRRKLVTDSFNDEIGTWVEAYMRAQAIIERASNNKATGPEAKEVIALDVAEHMLKVAEMFEQLGGESGDGFAGKMGWSSAEELSQFLWREVTPAN